MAGRPGFGVNYFIVLPTELKLLQALFLNYLETSHYCQVNARVSLSCSEGEIWQFKIRHELHTIPAQYLPTLTPLSRKYLEIKSITGIDFGSEYYLNEIPFIRRAARVRDSAERRRLIDYFFQLKFADRLEGTTAWALLTGLLAVNDTPLYNHYVRGYQFKLTPDEMFGIRVQGYAEGGNWAELATIEQNNPAIYADHFNMRLLDGLAAGGHLEQLKQYADKPILANSFNDVFQAASENGQEAIIEYLVSLFLTRDGHLFNQSFPPVSDMIANNRPEFSLGILTRLHGELSTLYPRSIYYKRYWFVIVAEDAARIGSFLLLDYSFSGTSLTRQLPDLMEAALRHNHLDALAYLYGRGGRYGSFTEAKFIRLHPVTAEVALRYQLVSRFDIEKIVPESEVLTNKQKSLLLEIAKQYR